MRHVALEARVDDRLHDRRVVELLRLVDLVAAGNAGRVVMADQLVVLPDRGDDVPFHHLRVVDVVEQLHARGVDRLDDLEAVRSVRADVILVVDEVQVLDQDRHAHFLGDGLALLQALDAVGDAFLVAHPAAVAEEADDVRHACLLGLRDVLLERLDDAGVVLLLVQAVRDRPGAHDAHGGHEAGVARLGPLRGIEDIDRRKPHLAARFQEIRQLDLPEAPPGHGLLDPPVLHDLPVLPAPSLAEGSRRGRRQGRAHRGRARRHHRFASGESGHGITPKRRTNVSPRSIGTLDYTEGASPVSTDFTDRGPRPPSTQEMKNPRREPRRGWFVSLERPTSSAAPP